MFAKLKKKHEQTLASLESRIELKKQSLKELEAQAQTALYHIADLRQEERDCLKAKESAQKELEAIQNKISAYGLLEEVAYDYIPTNEIQSELEEKLSNLELKMGRMVSLNSALNFGRDYVIDGSLSKGLKFRESFGKNLLIGFNTYVQKKQKYISLDNYSTTIQLIERRFKKYNRQGDVVKVYISEDYLNITKEITKLKLDIKIAKAEEKEKIRQEKHRLKEQEKLLEELKKEQEKLEKERRYYEAVYGETESDTKRLEIQQLLEDIDKRQKDLDYRNNNLKAGWLYVAYSKAMPNWVKIGVSRRLQPLVRLQELSSASVPYPFECKGLVFSDNVFELEAKVHSYFDKQRVNRYNRHKEFFCITPERAITVLKHKFNCEIIFTEGLDK